MRKENLGELYNRLLTNGFQPYYVDEFNICVSTEEGDFYITESAAINYFGVEKNTPFEEKEYFAINGIDSVMTLLGE